MRQPNNVQWWSLVIVAMFIVAAWPPAQGKSLGMTIVNWAVDPKGELPVLPPPLGFGVGDDVDAVNARDEVVREYDMLYMQGGWTRRRLVWKVANDPFNKATTRQVLSAVGVLAVLLAWRVGGRSS